MKMRIREDTWYGTRFPCQRNQQRCSTDANEQSTFSTETGDYISGRADKNEGTCYKAKRQTHLLGREDVI
jgi:hypothetical protein